MTDYQNKFYRTNHKDSETEEDLGKDGMNM
jgi:hypothetical protein